MDQSFFAGKRILVTGHSGFKGSWLCLWLEKLHANVAGLSLADEYSPLLYRDADVRQSLRHEFQENLLDAPSVQAAFESFRPEIVFHLAAQSILRNGYRKPSETWSTNVLGTLNVLEASRRTPETQVLVVCTTDKVYDAFGASGAPFRESDRLGGHDPYSSSKASVEIMVDSWRRSYWPDSQVSVSTARAGNVLGGGDWGEFRLMPNAIKALYSDSPVPVYTKFGVRPWQHVLDCLSGYMTLAERQWGCKGKFCQAYNIGSHESATAEEIVQLTLKHWGSGSYSYCPAPNANQELETDILRLDVSKAKDDLGWSAKMSIEQAVRWTVYWYKHRQGGCDARDLCVRQIERYDTI